MDECVEIRRLARDERSRVSEIDRTEHIELLSRMRAVLRDYQRLCDTTGFAAPEVTERMTIDPNDVRDLEALGYL